MQGAKADGLSFAKRLVSVPAFRVLDSDVFEHFLAAHDLTSALDLLCELNTRADGLSLGYRAAELRRHLRVAVVALEMSPELTAEVDRPFHSLVGRSPDDFVLMARSSTSVEDGSVSSWAGQFRTVFGVRTIEEWRVAVRKVWASVVLEPAQIATQSRDQRPRMGVVLQRQVDARAGGVMVCEGPDEPDVLIEAVLGLAAPLVAGAVRPERWRWRGDIATRLETATAGEVWLTDVKGDHRPGITRWCADAHGTPVELRGTGGSTAMGVWSGWSHSDGRTELEVLTEAEVAELVRVALRLVNVRRSPIDVEWVLDQSGRIWVTQVRPVTVAIRPGDPADALWHDLPGVVCRGITASPGAATGPACFLDGDGHGSRNALTEADGSVLFVRSIAASHVSALHRCAALVTAEGGILSHAAIAARELGIPAVVSATPYPPPVSAGDIVSLDESGVVLAQHTKMQEPWSTRCLLEPANPLGEIPSLVAHVGPSLERLWPMSARGDAERVVSVPGVLGDVHVTADLRSRERGIGFPSGICFRSGRFHPTAVCDQGDGLRLFTFPDLRSSEVTSVADDLLAALADAWAGTTDNLTDTELRRHCAEGLESMAGDGSDVSRERTSHGGAVPGGDAAALPDSVRTALSESWGRRDGLAGHFLDIATLVDGPEEGGTVIVLHTGCDIAGREFLRWSSAVARVAAGLEGVDDDDAISDGFYGAEVARATGDQLAAGAAALVNFAYARRVDLARRILSAIRSVVGKRPAHLISDWVHSACVADGDAFLYQQGVQVLEPEGPRPVLALVAGPDCESMLWRAPTTRERLYTPHGKASVPVTVGVDGPARRPAQIDGPLGGSDLVELSSTQAQAELAFTDLQETLGAVPAGRLRPLVCVRGTGRFE